MTRMTAELREYTKKSAKRDGRIWADVEDPGYGE